MTKLIIGFFLWLLFIAWEVRRNYRIIEVHKESPDYLNSFFVRAFFGLVALALMSGDYDPFMEWYHSLPIVTYEVTSFYLVFDVWLNVRRGKAWNYRGKNSGWLDKLPIHFYYVLKVVCLVGLVWSIQKLL